MALHAKLALRDTTSMLLMLTWEPQNAKPVPLVALNVPKTLTLLPEQLNPSAKSVLPDTSRSQLENVNCAARLSHLAPRVMMTTAMMKLTQMSVLHAFLVPSVMTNQSVWLAH